MSITIWSTPQQDKEIMEIAGIVIPENNGDITLNGKKIGYSDFFEGHQINHPKTEKLLRDANKFCIWVQLKENLR